MQGFARTLSERVSAWWLAPAPARRLGLLRLIVGLAALAQLAVETPSLLALLDLLPEQFHPVGVSTWLTQPVGSSVLYVCLGVAFVSGAGFALGALYSYTAPVFALTLLALMTYRSSWGMVLHTDNLLVLHVLLLALSPAAAAYSVDARRASEVVPPDESRASYGWPLRALSIATVICYVLAGVAKLKLAGGTWFGGELLRAHIAFDNLRKLELGSWVVPLGPWLVRFPAVFPALAALTLAVELGAPLALVSKRCAAIWAIAAWCFHLGVLLTMTIAFTYQLFGIAYLSFFAIERAADRAARVGTRHRGIGGPRRRGDRQH